MDDGREREMTEAEWAYAVSSGEDDSIRGGLVYCEQGHPGRPNGDPCGPCEDEIAAGIR